MTELSFMISLLLDEELPPKIKTMVANRIREVEEKYSQAVVAPIQRQGLVGNQSLQNHIPPQVEQAVPHSVAAAQALAERQKAIQIAASGKPEDGRTSPRKF